MRDDEVREFRSQLRLLHRRLRSESRPVPGVSRTAMQVLAAISRLPAGDAQPRLVADTLAMTSSNVAAALRELAAADFIRREKDPSDARRVQLSMTDEGEAVLASVRSERDTWLGRAVTVLLNAEEQRELVATGRLLQRIAEFQLAELQSSEASEASEASAVVRA